MCPATTESQMKFLISCIRYSNNGKVDFTEVARECGIVSKGAAAKRYERLMKTHGIPAAASPNSKISGSSDMLKKEGESSAKKRKSAAYEEEETAVDDEEDFDKIKSESGGGEKLYVKSEEYQVFEASHDEANHSPGKTSLHDGYGLAVMGQGEESMTTPSSFLLDRQQFFDSSQFEMFHNDQGAVGSQELMTTKDGAFESFVIDD